MRTQTITVKALRFGNRGILIIIATCLLLASVFAQQTAEKKLPAGARINKNEVIAVQVELRRLGYLKTGITGQLDSGTSEAVKAYQRKNGLPVSGGIDSATYAKLDLPYPAPNPNDPNLVQRTSGAVKNGTLFGVEKTRDAGTYAATKSKEGGRYALEKGWDGGAYVATKSKDAAKASVKGTKTLGRLGGRKAVSMIRRKDDDIYPDLAELFFEHHDWNGVRYTVTDGMVTLKIPTKSKVDVGNIASEVRKVAGVRSVFVVAL